MQNDDWVYYKIIQSFLAGNFALDSITAPTFYTQGFLAFLFAKFFGIQNIPLLTLLISFIVCVLFWLIINKFFIKDKLTALLVMCLLLFNPWFVYSAIGFMTENYFLLFTLINLYLFNLYEQQPENKRLNAILYISIFISFMLRQVALVFPLAMSAYYILSKKYKQSTLAGSIFIGLYLFYLYIFPKTAEMNEKRLQIQHILDIDYSFSLGYGSLIILCALLLPLFISMIINHIESYKKILVISLTAVFLFLSLNTVFKPAEISWGEFPYFENIWERTGLYPRGILGTKYQFKWNYDLYYYWDLAAKVILAVYISTAIFSYKKRDVIDFNLIYIVLYLVIMLITETFYDRYLLTLVPFVILHLLKHISLTKISKVGLFIFTIFLGVYTYQLGMDFVILNKYVWTKSQELVTTQNVDPELIQGTNAWKLNYRNTGRTYLYDFSYDSPEVNEVYKNNYLLVEKYKVDFLGSIFINPYIYLYRRL